MERVLTLEKATLTLYRSGPDGVTPAGSALFMGACAEGLKLRYTFEELESRPSGSAYPKTRHINEQHVIEIERVWIVDAAEFSMERNAEYILEIRFDDPNDPEGRLTRTYFGVTNRSADLSSQGITEFMQDQAFKAQYFTSALVES